MADQGRKAIAWAATVAIVATTGAAHGRAAAVVETLGAPLRGLTVEERARFDEGREAFIEVEDVDDGLGPVFNGDSCAGCHNEGAIGGGSAVVETRFGTRAGGVFDPMASHGGSLIQTDGIGAQGACTFAGEEVPAEASVVAGRRTTPLFGLGLVDAVPDGLFVALAAYQARYRPTTAGRVHWVTDAVSGKRAAGRFGWKNQVPSLMHFSADAYLNEMGITTPTFAVENCPQGDCTLLACDPVADPEDDGEDVVLFREFMALLAPPAAPRLDRDGAEGRRIFDRIGCGGCHVPALVTGASPVRALHKRAFQPYSDFLLHDMGALGDGIEQGDARANEMRTAPLWGLRAVTTFLHDGRATTVADAILAHDGQGRPARARFAALKPADRARLLKFLGSL
jgi:CxxC motif-containing protein (DUF1111 family)